MRPTKTRITSKFVPMLVALIASGLFVSVVLALFSNGGFETGDFTGWTKTYFLNYGLTGSQPFTGASISRTVGGSDQSVVLGPFPLMSQSDPNTGGNLRYPRFGQYLARVNGLEINRISNSLVQSSTVTAGDIYSRDGQIHIMFAYAPVLQDPAHNPDEQPYFYIAVKNLTRGGALLYEKFIFSGQPGVPWQTAGPVTETVKYTDWQIVDVVPGAGNIAVSDVVELEVIGADCSLGAHFGYVYVDVFGSSIPTLHVIKKAPAQVYRNSDLVYHFTYVNNTGGTANNVFVVENIPAKTTFVSADPGCGHNAGVVTCTLGTLSAGIAGTFQITVHISSGVTGTVDNGNYYIYGDEWPPLLGALVSTPIVGRAPIANAGLDQTVDLSTTVTLDGSGSTDPDGYYPLKYSWQQTGGPAVILSSPVISRPTFAAPGTPAVLTFTLVVTNSVSDVSVPDEVVVTVIPRTADLSISKMFQIRFLTDITSTIIVKNLSNDNAADGAVVSDTVPAYITGATWTCSGSNGATCTANGSGNIYDTLASFPPHGVVTYTLQGLLTTWGHVENTATVTAPAGVADPDLSNNTATAYRYRLFFMLIYKDYVIGP